MHKSAQLRDITTQWLEKRKNCVPDTRMSNLTPPAHRQSIGRAIGGDGCGTATSTIVTASSSSMVTVTRLTAAVNHSAAKAAAAAKNKRNGTKPYRRLPPPPYVKLAEENAPAFSENCDSDTSSLYDSANEIETDTAKDESDYSDGYVTDGFATMDVFEYEVDDLSDSEDLESHGSSSGTDDMVEVVARAIFGASSSSSSSSGSDFEIFAQDADTEESDAPTDPELGRADYWTCIKCKNQKNNPMYRYCEKCYQIRKTHFPPRPKYRRKRSSLAQRGNSKLCFSSPSTSSTISMQDEKRGRGMMDDDDDDDNDDVGGDDGRISRYSSCDGNEQLGNQLMQKSMQSARKQFQPRRRTISSSHKQQQQLQQQQQKTHSAGESSCCSSQELSPDEQPSTLSSQAAYLVAAACASSQETYCSDIEHIVNHNSIVISPKQSNSIFEHNYPNSQDSVYPNSEGSLIKLDSLASTVSADSVFGSSQSANEFESNETTTTASGVNQTKSNGNDSVSKSKSSSSRDNEVTTTIATTTTATKAASVEKTPSSITPINRTPSEARVSSSRKLKKRKIDFSDEVSDAEINDDELMTKQFRAMDETDSSNGMCMICLSKPKNAAFVHNRFLHVCCCYGCTVKVWNKRKKCPICNSHVRTVLKLFVH